MEPGQRKRTRANGEGMIVARKNGKGKTYYEGSITVGYEDGKQKRRWVTASSHAEVRTKLDALRRQRDEGCLMTADARHTLVGDFLKSWLEAVKPNLKSTTVMSYKNTLKKHLIPALGNLKLEKIGPKNVQDAYTQLLANGCSRHTVAYSHKILRAAFRQGVRWRMLTFNPAEGVQSPKTTRIKPRIWTRAEANGFFNHPAVLEHRLYALWHLAMVTGMRRGELLALEWDDIDFENGKLRVSKNLVQTADGLLIDTPKTESGNRTVFLGADTLTVLRTHQTQQAEARIRVEHRHGGRNVPKHNDVFTSRIDTLLIPGGITRAFSRLMDRTNVPKITLHKLRHMNATVLLMKGYSVNFIQEQLGHSSIEVTLGVYGHVLNEQREQARFNLTDLLGELATTQTKAEQQSNLIEIESEEATLEETSLEETSLEETSLEDESPDVKR